MESLLSIQGLSVGYPSGSKGNAASHVNSTHAVLTGVDLELRPGELVCLLGPNGAGKSTLLRTLAGLQPALAGRVILGGEDAFSLPPDAWARKVAIVLTERIDAGSLLVYDLACLGRHPFTGWLGRLSHADHEAVRRGLEEAGAWELRDRFYEELSDGEKQRVMLARALAQEPMLLLLDEPTAFLDLPRRVETMRSLRRLAHERGRAVLLSTHDLDLAMRAADRLWLVPPGGPVQSGLPEDLALEGALGRVFDQGDVAFDLASGQFRVHGHPLRKAHISGDPLLVFWTGRALEREGYAVDSDSVVTGSKDLDGADIGLRISASRTDGRANWRFESKPGPKSASSLAELIRVLRTF